MEAIKEFEKKHKDIKAKLSAVAKEKINRGEMMNACKGIAKRLKVSPQTVYNYVVGTIKDGYLAEAILQEFESLESEK